MYKTEDKAIELLENDGYVLNDDGTVTAHTN